MLKVNGVWLKLVFIIFFGVWSFIVGYKFDCNDNDIYVYYIDVGIL